MDGIGVGRPHPSTGSGITTRTRTPSQIPFVVSLSNHRRYRRRPPTSLDRFRDHDKDANAFPNTVRGEPVEPWTVSVSVAHSRPPTSFDRFSANGLRIDRDGNASVVVEAAHQQRRNPATVPAPLRPFCSTPAKSSGAGVICSDAAAPDSAREIFLSIGGAAELQR